MGKTVFKYGIAVTNLGEDSNGGSPMEFIRSVDAATTPLGVAWMDGQTLVVGTLAPSEDTVGKMYFVPNGSTGKNQFDEYVTMNENGVYSWENLGIKVNIPTKISQLRNDVPLVSTESQSLTAAQQQQARQNIGASHIEIDILEEGDN